MSHMNAKKVNRHPHSLDHSNKDHIRAHLDAKFEQVLSRINSIKKLINAEKDELASENLKRNKKWKNGQTRFQSTEDDLNMIEPQGILLLHSMILQNASVISN